MLPPTFGGYGAALLALGWAFATVATALIAMRIYVRVKLSPHGTWPLFWTIVAWLGTVFETSFSTVAILGGLGNHIDVVAENGSVPHLLFWSWLTCFFFVVNLALGKIAAASFILALHTDTHSKRTYLLYFVIASTVIVSIPDAVYVWTHCDPPSALFDPLQQDHCNISSYIHYATFVCTYSGFCDIVLSILPILLVWPLQMRLRLKIFVCILMSLGVIAAAASFIVAYYVKDFASPDFSYDISVLYLWGKSSGWLVIICASIPPVWPLFSHWFGKNPSTRRRQSKSQQNGTFIALGDSSSDRLSRNASHTQVPPQFSITKHVQIDQQEEHIYRDI